MYCVRLLSSEFIITLKSHIGILSICHRRGPLNFYELYYGRCGSHKESLKNEPKKWPRFIPFFFSLKPSTRSLLSLVASRRNFDSFALCFMFFRERSETHKGDFWHFFPLKNSPQRKKQTKEECFGKLKFNCDALFYVESIRYVLMNIHITDFWAMLVQLKTESQNKETWDGKWNVTGWLVNDGTFKLTKESFWGFYFKYCSNCSIPIIFSKLKLLQIGLKLSFRCLKWV